MQNLWVSTARDVYYTFAHDASSRFDPNATEVKLFREADPSFTQALEVEVKERMFYPKLGSCDMLWHAVK